jgi:hypothetical protein
MRAKSLTDFPYDGDAVRAVDVNCVPHGELPSTCHIKANGVVSVRVSASAAQRLGGLSENLTCLINAVRPDR